MELASVDCEAAKAGDRTVKQLQPPLRTSAVVIVLKPIMLM